MSFKILIMQNISRPYCLKSLITDRFCTIECKFVNIRSISKVSNFIFVSNNHLSIKIETDERMYLRFNYSDDNKGNIRYLLIWFNHFDELFYQKLFSYLKSEVEFIHFNPRIIPETDIKIEMLDTYKKYLVIILWRGDW
jgi:hypothetical protein